MSEVAVLTLELDQSLRDQFVAEAAAAARPVAEVLQALMRDYVEAQHRARANDARIRAAIEEGVRQADDPKAVWIPHEEVSARWKRQRAELLRRADEQAG